MILQVKLTKLLRRLEIPCNNIHDGNVAIIYDVIFGGKRIDCNDKFINYYIGISCVIKKKVTRILELHHCKIILEEKDRRIIRIKQTLERYGYVGLNLSYYTKELIDDHLDPQWNLIVEYVELEMKKYFKKAGDSFALFELHQYCNKGLSFDDIKQAGYDGHARALLLITQLSSEKTLLPLAANLGNMDAAIELYNLDKKKNINYLKKSVKLGHVNSTIHLGSHYVDAGDHWNAFRCFVKGFIEKNDNIVDKINEYSVKYFGFKIPIEIFDHVGVNSLTGLCLINLFDLNGIDF